MRQLLNTVNQLILYNRAIILDLRTDYEFCTGHICGAIKISTPHPPLNKDELKKLQSRIFKLVKHIPRTRPIIIYCQLGRRSKIGYSILKKLGFEFVYNLGGVKTNPLKWFIHNLPFSDNYEGINFCYCYD